MDLWDSFWSALAEFIAENGLFAVALIVLLRSAAIPIPVPADLLVIVVGARAQEQQVPLWPAWVLLACSTTAGAALLYAFVRWVGQGDVTHYGRYIGLTTERLNAAETQLVERGTRAIFVARIVPGLRLAIVAVCGMLRFGWWKFLGAVFLGALMYVGICLMIGYFFGDAVEEFVGDLVFPLAVLEPVLGLGILLFWLVHARRSTPRAPTRKALNRPGRVRVGALAGALAIVGSTMLVNLLIYLIAPAVADARNGIRRSDALVTASGGLGSVVVAVVDSIVLGILWGIVYAIDDERQLAGWSDSLRGLAFAVFPFLLVMLVQSFVVLKAEIPVGGWLILGLGEAIRWGAYGVLIGLMYPVLRTRRVQAQPNHQSTDQARLVVETEG
jgi:membrane protein DedA with SNARE-associated domain